MFFILTTQELSVNRIDLQAPILAGPAQANQGAGLLAALHLNNQLYMLKPLRF